MLACSKSQPAPPNSAAPDPAAPAPGSAPPAASKPLPASAAASGSASAGSAAAGVLPAPGKVTATITDEPSRFVVTIERDGVSKQLVDVPSASEDWDEVTSDVVEVEGSEGRVFMASKQGSSGADLHRSGIAAWVIDASRDLVLWSGEASYSNTFDECEELVDVPEPKIERKVLVMRVVNGTNVLMRGTRRCKAVREKRMIVARVPLR